MLKLKLILFDFHNIDGLLVNATLVSIPKNRKITKFLPFVNDLKTLNRIFFTYGQKSQDLEASYSLNWRLYMFMKQDFDKISNTLSTVSYDSLKESPLANFCLNTRK